VSRQVGMCRRGRKKQDRRPERVISPCFSLSLPRASESHKLFTTLMPRISAYSLFECNAYTDLGIFEQIRAIHPYDPAALDAGKLPFFLRQDFRTWEVKLDVVARPDRGGHWKCNKYTRFANIAASANDKSVGLRYPDTHRPGNIAPALFTLLG